MDKRLLDLYNQELAHLRATGAEFARQFPKIAGRLGGLDEFQPCRDPFVERLLEGFAFLAARVQLKLEAQFPRFTQSLLETVYPHHLAPTPSMCIAQFEPDFEESALAEGFVIPRGTSLSGTLGKGEQTRCVYRTAHDVTLWPVRIGRAGYYTRELASIGVAEVPGAAAGIHIRLQCTAGLKCSDLNMNALTFYLMGVGATAMSLYEQLFANAIAVVVQPASRPAAWQKVMEPSCIRPVGFEDDQRLLPYDARSFQGYRLVHEYFAFPQRFMSFEITDLAEAVKSCDESELDLTVIFAQRNEELEGIVSASNFGLFCSPVINLFEKRLDRIPVSDRTYEFHVVPDRTRPQDFEVYEITRVTGYGADSKKRQEFSPFYRARDETAGAEGYYAVNRIPRPLSEKERLKVRRSQSYAGSEVYLSLVDSAAAPYRTDIAQLGVEGLCTNRDLPLHMAVGLSHADFTMTQTAPCTSIRCLGTPTAPRASHVVGEFTWRIISHLSLNYLSLSDDRQGASALRDILKLYGDNNDPQIGKQIDGVKSVTCKPITRRVTAPGSIAFARGLEITVTLEEASSEGTGVFLLGAVLARFFAKYVSVNSFAETVIRTVERGEIMRWTRRNGLRALL